jgi:hypothetical protein
MHETDMNQQLCTAITRRSLIMFEYGDLIRVVEPHRVGINSAGHPMLSGWLRAGYSRSDPAGGWRNYLLSDIRGLQLLDAPFAGTRPGYSTHDARMREVLCQLTPTAVEALPSEGPYVVREPLQRTTTPDERRGDEGRSSGSARPHDGDAEPPDTAF